MKNKALLFVVTLITCDLSAQITEIGVLPSDPGFINRLTRSLSSAGPKLMTMAPEGFTLYNTDLSPYQTISYPTPPAGYEWNWWSPLYVSEDLFDTDASTLEYLLPAGATGDPNVYGTAILRTDGTTLFWTSDESPFYVTNADQLTPASFIWNTPAGAMMQLFNNAAQMRYFQLPGMLPCLECNGTVSASMITLGDDPQLVTSPDGMSIFPNPASTSSEIVFGTGSDVHVRTLLLINAGGAVIKRLPVPNGADRMTVGVAEVAAGMYSYRLETDHGILPGKRLVIVR